MAHPAVTKPKPSPLADSHGRAVSYMRLSVTDRCNLRCRYCRRPETPFIDHQDILRYEEMLRLAAIANGMGVEKLRLTGGEPFLRKDFLWFLGELRGRLPAMDLRVTTNATLLEGKAAQLARLGVERVNISLDTLDREAFARVTGRDRLPQVLAGIDDCLQNGIAVKLNAVAMADVNREQLPAFLDFARNRGIEVRFIEYMPHMGKGELAPARWKAADILAEAARHAELAPLAGRSATDGPARVYSIDGGPGRLGVISPMSDHFCDTCNRLRVTSDGVLRTCLFSDKGYRLRPLLRSPRFTDAHLERVIRLAAYRKPIGNQLISEAACRTSMTAIGG